MKKILTLFFCMVTGTIIGYLLVIPITNITLINNIADTLNTHSKKITELETRINTLKETMNLKSVQKVTVTAYSARRIETDDTPMITASMTKVREGTVAVSRDLFKQGWVFGKKVYIQNYGIFEINDLMNSRYTNRIDIFIWNTNKAYDFGKKKLTVALLEL